MSNKYLLLIPFLFSNLCFAKNYTIDFVVDEFSKEHVNSIKKEVSSLFSNHDNILYNISICKIIVINIWIKKEK